MWHFKKPSEDAIRVFLASQSGLPLSYPEVGSTQHEPPPGYVFDHNRVALGRGAIVFEAACAAICQWRMFPRPWTEIHPADTPIQVGNAVAVLARAVGLWWLNACRIVYVIDESGPPRRYGFAYGTLPGHVESGEERFLIEWDREDTVWYDLSAFSRPKAWMVRCAYPLARRQQRRFAVHSLVAMREAAAGPAAQRLAD
jgi:uncharacterized protein (UPF0548 family)